MAVAILTVGGMVFVPHVAVANPLTTIVTGATEDFAANIIAGIANFFLMLTAKFVYISGIFLSLSMNISIHIKEILEGTAKNPGGMHASIDVVWTTVRDLSSIFIIFSLLYCSILTILGQAKTGLNQLIIKIFLAGVFINFSLFFVKVAVDASNLVSLQFYNAIAPNTSTNLDGASAFSDGGLSNVFMQSLKIPTIYGDNGFLKSTNVMSAIGLATAGGIILMVTAALSFLAAAIAFTIRTAIILFVMALSPLYFAGVIFPMIEEKVSKPLFNLLKGQLIFMPAYLFLLYVSLKLISNDNFMKIFNSTPAGSSGFGTLQIGVILQYAIALIFINAPLIAAIHFGGMGMKWTPGSSGINAVNKWIGGKVGGFAGRHTVGRFGEAAGEAFDSRAAQAQKYAIGRAASSVLRGLNISQTVRGGLTSAEKGKYGGRENLAGFRKEDKERAKVVSGVGRSNKQEADILAVVGRNAAPTPIQMTDFAKTVGKMNKKELEEVEFERLSNPVFVSKLSSKQFETLMEGDSLTPNRQDELKKIREGQLTNDLKGGTEKEVKEIVKNLSGKEIAKLDPENKNGILSRAEVWKSLNISHLQDMKDLDGPIKKEIRDNIAGLPVNSHPARGWIMKSPEWR